MKMCRLTPLSALVLPKRLAVGAGLLGNDTVRAESTCQT